MTVHTRPGTTFGAFEPLMHEHDYLIDQIDGRLPAELTGTLYRIGPGKWQVGDTMLGCLFDGDGMVAQFTLDGTGVRFRNRYVRTPQFRHGLTSSRMRRPGLGTPLPGGRWANLRRPPGNVANTNVSFHAGDLLALWEGGKPYRIDADTLETLGEHDFDGRLRGMGAFSAHPKWDPLTGEMFNFGLAFFPTPRLNCYAVGRTGRLRRLGALPMRDLPWNHDFALTPKHLVFVLDPILPNLRRMVLSDRPLIDALDYRADKGTRFALVPRGGGRPRIIEHDALLHVHVTNAYEDGSDTVVDLVRFEDWDLLKRKIVRFRDGFADLPASRLMRYRITASGKVIERELAPCHGEFPQYDWRVSTRRHRFTYLTGRTGASGLYDTVLKIDHDTGTVSGHHLGAGNQVGEPLFVPRTPDAAEDDGWLLAVNYNAGEHRSQLMVLDAGDLDRGPIAVAHLRHHLPFGFHGTFTRRVAVEGAPVPHPDDLPIR